MTTTTDKAINVKIKNAIISCYDKNGLKEFVSELVKLNPEIKIYCSSGTFKELEPVAKDNIIEVSDYVGFKEMPSGLVKTLNPKLHAGILADLDDEKQVKYLEENKIVVFDIVVVNLYPFEKIVAAGGSVDEARKNIDIGGVSLLEAASKNFPRVTAVSDINDYDKLLETLRNNNGASDDKTRLEFAKKALSHLHHYMSEINKYFQKLE